jgi:hypothetical protein
VELIVNRGTSLEFHVRADGDRIVVDAAPLDSANLCGAA